VSDAAHVTVELHLATAAVLLESLLGEREPPSSPLPVAYSKAWHRQEAIDALRVAIRDWGATNT
jgi:hypothetical protein